MCTREMIQLAEWLPNEFRLTFNEIEFYVIQFHALFRMNIFSQRIKYALSAVPRDRGIDECTFERF